MSNIEPLNAESPDASILTTLDHPVKDTRPPSQSYGYNVIIFDPQEKFEWAKGIDPYSASADELLELMKRAIAPFTEKQANGRARSAETNGAMVGCELSPGEHKFHMHIYLFSKNRLKLDYVQSLYPRMHIESVRGSAEECWEYLLKSATGKHTAKAETKLCEPYQWGSWAKSGKDLRNERKEAKVPIAEEINDLLDKGFSPDQISSMGFEFGSRKKGIDATFFAQRKANAPLIRDVKVVYHFGASGSGKTYAAYDKYLLENPDKPAPCVLTASQHTFDAYRCEPYVVIEELRGEYFNQNPFTGAREPDVPLNVLLKALDRHAIYLPARYQDTFWCPTEIHITSIYPPDKLYSFDEYETCKQLLRRISEVVYHWRDQRGFYRSFSLSGEECCHMSKGTIRWYMKKEAEVERSLAKRYPVLIPPKNTQQ